MFKKKVILPFIATASAILLTGIGYLSFPQMVSAENGGAITVFDDFTQISNIEDANEVGGNQRLRRFIRPKFV